MKNAIGFCAERSNAGKTTLLLNVLEEFKRRGIKAAVLKHGKALSKQDTDSSRFADGGEVTSLFVAKEGFVLEERRELSFLDAVNLLRTVSGTDLVLVEGYKHEKYDKIAVLRKEISLTIPNDGIDICAIVTDTQIDTELPQFSFDEIEEICNFILKRQEEAE